MQRCIHTKWYHNLRLGPDIDLLDNDELHLGVVHEVTVVDLDLGLGLLGGGGSGESHEAVLVGELDLDDAVKVDLVGVASEDEGLVVLAVLHVAAGVADGGGVAGDLADGVDVLLVLLLELGEGDRVGLGDEDEGAVRHFGDVVCGGLLHWLC